MWNDTYHSFTVSLIDDGWNMRTLALDCTKATGSAKGEDLAQSVVAQVEKHKLEGRVTDFTTDCEPSMVKAGRLVEEQGVAKHHDCCNRRLERITGIVFNGPGVLETMVLSRMLVRRYTTSSQAAQRLGESLVFLKMPTLKAIQDVETRWCSTHACLERLLYLRSAITMHEASIASSSNTQSARILSDKHWAVIESIVPLLELLMLVQRALEAQKYVTISLVVPNIQALRTPWFSRRDRRTAS